MITDEQLRIWERLAEREKKCWFPHALAWRVIDLIAEVRTLRRRVAELEAARSPYHAPFGTRPAGAGTDQAT